MSFYLILKKIMEDKGLSIPEVARMCGLHDSTVRSAIDRQQKKVELSNAIKYSRGLGVSLEYLNGDTTEKAPANAEAIHIDSTIQKYAQLDEHGKRIVAAVTNIEYERCTSIQNQPQLRVARGGRVTTEPLPDDLTLDDDTSDLDS